MLARWVLIIIIFVMGQIDKGLAKQIGRREAFRASLVFCVLFFITLEVLEPGSFIIVLGFNSKMSIPILFTLTSSVTIGWLLGGWCGIVTVHKMRSVSYSFVWALITYVLGIAVLMIFSFFWSGSYTAVGTTLLRDILLGELLAPVIMTEFVFPPLILAAMFYAWRLERNIARLNAVVA